MEKEKIKIIIEALQKPDLAIDTHSFHGGTCLRLYRKGKSSLYLRLTEDRYGIYKILTESN